MLKIQDKEGKTKFVLRDEDEEPTPVTEIKDEKPTAEEPMTENK